MSWSEIPCLSIAIAPLKTPGTADRFAIWVFKAPSPSGYVHHDRSWPETLSQTWYGWQQMFSVQPAPLPGGVKINPHLNSLDRLLPGSDSSPASYSARLMQHLGLNLWQWLFSSSIDRSFAQSLGIALGQDRPLRIQLDIRDPDLMVLPWEIMQPRAGKPAISLDRQLRFSRTTSDVDPLAKHPNRQSLKVLLVLGAQTQSQQGSGGNSTLDLDTEAATLSEVLQNRSARSGDREPLLPVPCHVTPLIQPSVGETVEQLETGEYNIFFYAGHGVPGPTGGQLRLNADTVLTGTELAQILVRSGVTLAVFNACWGAWPDRHNQQATPRSSLAEVLIHHGVPAVLAMRDSIADAEALSFIRAFAQALAERNPIDRAVAIARQQLLTLYKFNQPAWTLPVLYLHPEFDGELIAGIDSLITELPENTPSAMGLPLATALLRSPDKTGKVWPIRNGMLSVGRRSENDLVIPERWVSQRHAEIFYRNSSATDGRPCYFLRDFSRYGTLVHNARGWQKIHHQELRLESGDRLKFGSSQGETLEFVVEALSLEK
ncbi:CHAT domain-containing protein [Oxynema aestuarii]|uniref:CHAT domain-containing protein n=1 Tax=Oxynema aestuarii AP17 TaxID=2064643 RepID=A0A6H1TWC6_9CYAN|nr:CHAT domain-containing protein [Oxynema aestuarii]QIZ70908.1 CHAT domain-containing protein [Oxynema aestuarii AP17]